MRNPVRCWMSPQPCGDLVLDESDGPLVLVSAGIGITPIAAIVEDLSRRQPERQVRIFHADTSHSNHALYQPAPTGALHGRRGAQNWYEEDAESAPTLHPARPGSWTSRTSDPFGRDGVHVRSAAVHAKRPAGPCSTKGVSGERVHYEVFGPDLWAQNADNAKNAK